jgi:uncharacterized protein (TIGR01777 family)
MAGKIVIAGGSGFVGSALIPMLQESGREVVVLRRSRAEMPNVRSVHWDGRNLGPWAEEFRGATAVVNLAGESISQRWTEDAKRRILGSRLVTTAAIGEAIESFAQEPFRWLNASAVGFYGDRGEERVDESSGAGKGFLAETTQDWEATVGKAAPAWCETSRLRFGMILGDSGGAFPLLERLARLGAGGAVGNGRQGVSWIHIEDAARMLVWALDLPEIPAVINAVAPGAVSNAEFMAGIRKAVGAPFALPAPAFAVRAVGTLLGPDADLVLAGAYVQPQVAKSRGFEFRFPDLPAALQNLVKEAKASGT